MTPLEQRTVFGLLLRAKLHSSSLNIVMISKLATIVLTSILVLSVGLYRRIIRPRFFLRRVPRVVEASRLFYGHTGLIADAPTYAVHQRWHAKHGSLVTYDGLFNVWNP